MCICIDNLVTVPEYKYAAGAGGGAGFFSSGRIRTDFPEAWIWESYGGSEGCVPFSRQKKLQLIRVNAAFDV